MRQAQVGLAVPATLASGLVGLVPATRELWVPVQARVARAMRQAWARLAVPATLEQKAPARGFQAMRRWRVPATLKQSARLPVQWCFQATRGWQVQWRARVGLPAQAMLARQAREQTQAVPATLEQKADRVDLRAPVPTAPARQTPPTGQTRRPPARQQHH